MRIDSHDINSFRRVLRHLYIDAADRGSSPLHTNYIKPRLRIFFPKLMIDECLKILILMKELVNLGQGWIGPTKGYNIAANKLIVSLFGVNQHQIFENGSSGYSDLAQLEHASLHSWLGPPFMQIGIVKNVGLRATYSTKKMYTGDEIYWTDIVNLNNNSSNWIVKSSFDSQRTRFTLYRQKGPFCFNYMQEDLELKSALTTNQAYELMALKDTFRGRALPLEVIRLSGSTYSITPLRYHSTSMKRLLTLLSCAVSIQPNSISYELSEAALEEFKLLVGNFVVITTSRRK